MSARGQDGAADRLWRTAGEGFGWRELRPGQLSAMEQVMAGRDTLVVMPTGAGKSAVYQVPALLLDGPTVVVSPLLALQRDQIAGLPARHARRAVAVNSAQTASGTAEAWEAVDSGSATYVFLSPEQLAKDEVLERLERAAPALFVVDEAQCVSAWGHDFRPDYLRLAQAARRVGRPPLLALTATAAPPVRQEIVDRLGMDEPALVVAGFDRPNIALHVSRFLDDDDKRRAVVERAAGEPKPGLVYAATRKDTERYADELAGLGLAAAAYHAGLRGEERSRVHDAFLDGTLDVVVATSAFGMGIDKEDVRFVLHASIPGSLDAYYQEVGRAGRDGKPALAVLHYRPEDTGMRNFFAARTPGDDTLGKVAEHLDGQEAPLPLDELREETGLSRNRLTAAVRRRPGPPTPTTRARCGPIPACPPTRRSNRPARPHGRGSGWNARAWRWCAPTPRRPAAAAASSWATSGSPTRRPAGAATCAKRRPGTPRWRTAPRWPAARTPKAPGARTSPAARAAPATGGRPTRPGRPSVPGRGCATGSGATGRCSARRATASRSCSTPWGTAPCRCPPWPAGTCCRCSNGRGAEDPAQPGGGPSGRCSRALATPYRLAAIARPVRSDQSWPRSSSR